MLYFSSVIVATGCGKCHRQSLRVYAADRSCRDRWLRLGLVSGRSKDVKHPPGDQQHGRLRYLEAGEWKHRMHFNACAQSSEILQLRWTLSNSCCLRPESCSNRRSFSRLGLFKPTGTVLGAQSYPKYRYGFQVRVGNRLRRVRGLHSHDAGLVCTRDI